MSGLSSCCVDVGAKQTHQSVGRVEEIAGIKTYQTGEGKSAIIIFTDVFGYSFVNIQKIADTFAQSCGRTVLIPDCFNGDAIDPNTPNVMAIIPDWLKKHPPSDACQIAEKFLSTIKGQYQSIQIFGLCYGGKVVVHLISHAEYSSTIQSAVVGHPSFLVKDEAIQIKRSILFLCAENDNLFTPELRSTFQEELTKNGLGKFLDFPHTNHGFVVRPHGSEQVQEQRNKAIQDAILFFKQNN